MDGNSRSHGAMTESWAPYDREAEALAAQYEALPFEIIHAALLERLPEPPAPVLDVGAGSGRDAAWFALRGHPVVAVEPSAGMRAEAQRRHPHPAIQWVVDALPDLAGLAEGAAFDLVLLSGVWMHVPPADRPHALRTLAARLSPAGRLAITLRHGPVPPGRGFHPVSAAELIDLATPLGLTLLCRADEPDALQRPGVSWTTLVFQSAGGMGPGPGGKIKS